MVKHKYMDAWISPPKSVKLVRNGHEVFWLDRPSEAREKYVTDSNAHEFRMFNVYPNGFQADFGAL